MRLTFLGTGTSHGMPVVGCGCGACSSADPRDARYRASVLVEEEGPAGRSVLVVDAGPEFRLQALRSRIGRPGPRERLDALLLTHAHSDHVNGLDDLRPLTRNRVLPVYGDKDTLAETASRFAYAFRETQAGGGKPRIELLEPPEGGVDFGALRAVPVPVLHGRIPILGWRFGALAYLTDASSIPEASFGLLAGVEVLVVDGLRARPHETHFSFAEAIEAARRVGARRTWLTHICHESTHAEIEEYCAREGADVGARPAWDGLELEVQPEA